jgi:hypothetical protein
VVQHLVTSLYVRNLAHLATLIDPESKRMLNAVITNRNLQIALHDRVSLCNASDITESLMAIGSLKIEYGPARTALSEFCLSSLCGSD